MAITTWDGVTQAMAEATAGGRRPFFSKSSLSNAAAGQIFSLFRAGGYPAQGAIPGAWATCTDALTGSLLTFTNPTAPAESYLGRLELQLATTNGVIVYDRLGHMGGLSGTVTTAQTVSGAIPSGRLADANGLDTEWFLEWYTDTGGTGVNCTVTYTNHADVGSRTVVIALAATTRAGRMMPIIPTTSGDFIKSIQSIQLSATTGTAGSFGVTACRRIAGAYAIANQIVVYDAANLGIPRVPDDACLMLATVCSTTSTGIVAGQVSLIQG